MNFWRDALKRCIAQLGGLHPRAVLHIVGGRAYLWVGAVHALRNAVSALLM